ncbi:MAG TPA: CBS domain-containing protein [Patescibacteria group bacterium]|nr:CBS domain-containing protein [Patescibacteria group bacterium]
MNIKGILATKSRLVFTIRPQQTVAEAVDMLAKQNIGALVVTNAEGKIVGIITERDIIRQAAKSQSIFAQKVSDIMTRGVIVGLLEDDAMSVAHTMTERRFRHIPILDGEELIGIVSIGDLVKAQRDQYEGQIDTLETQILADER